jgi:hypothetical protein
MHATQAALQTPAKKLLEKSRGSEESFHTPGIAPEPGRVLHFAHGWRWNRQATAAARRASTCLISGPQARDVSKTRRTATRAEKSKIVAAGDVR